MAGVGPRVGADSRDLRGTRRRRVLVAACIGNAVEWYDFAVFGALASTLSRVFFPSAGDAALALTFAVLAGSVVARPVGAVLVGRRADRSGRRGTFGWTVLLMTAATASLALLPTWSSVGVLAPVLLLLARGAQAFSAGGEMPSAIAYLVESAPPGRRGWYGGWHLSSSVLGVTAGYAATAVLSAALSPDALDDWGWRVAFAVAVPIGLAGHYIRQRLEETPDFASLTAPAASRVADVVRAHRAAVVRGVAVVAAMSVAVNVWFVFVPNHLAATGVTGTGQALGGCVLGLLTAVAVAPVAGRLSDRLGRRPALVAATAGLTVAVVPAYALAHEGTTLALVVSNVVLGALCGSLVFSAFVAELFPTAVRGLGTAVTYALPTALLGGTAPLVATMLARVGQEWTVPGLVAVVAALGGLAAFRAAETAFTEPRRPSDP